MLPYDKISIFKQMLVLIFVSLIEFQPLCDMPECALQPIVYIPILCAIVLLWNIYSYTMLHVVSGYSLLYFSGFLGSLSCTEIMLEKSYMY